jgi:hypothetical protein
VFLTVVATRRRHRLAGRLTTSDVRQQAPLCKKWLVNRSLHEALASGVTSAFAATAATVVVSLWCLAVWLTSSRP